MNNAFVVALRYAFLSRHCNIHAVDIRAAVDSDTALIVVEDDLANRIVYVLRDFDKVNRRVVLCVSLGVVGQLVIVFSFRIGFHRD